MFSVSKIERTLLSWSERRLWMDSTQSRKGDYGKRVVAGLVRVQGPYCTASRSLGTPKAVL